MRKFRIGSVTFALGADDELSADLLTATSPEAKEDGLDAIRAAWKRPIRLTPAQARALRWWHRQGAVIAGLGCHVKARYEGGKCLPRWRIPGKAGADLSEPPSGHAVTQAVEAHRKALAKASRALRLILLNASRVGTKASLAKGAKTAAAVRELLAQGKPVHRIARLLGVTESHVRYIRRKANIPEKG